MSTPRFEIEPLVSPANPANTTAQIQSRQDYTQDALNTLADEAALEREVLHGLGRLQDAGCEISLGDDGVLRMANGYFLAGPGVADTEAEYFVGGRMVRVNGAEGYIEITGDDAPPLGYPDGVFGFMSAYGDVLWDEVNPPAAFARNGRWCIGKVTTDAASITAVDATVADIVPSLPGMLELINAGAGGGGGGGFEFWNLVKRSAIDPTTIAQFVASQIEAALGGNGTNLLPPEVRDEQMVNVLHSLALHQNYHNDAFANVPPHHAIVVSPGRGTGDWTYAELTDEELTTMPVDEVQHVFGQVA